MLSIFANASPSEWAFIVAYYVVITLCLAAFIGKVFHWGGLLFWWVMRPPCKARQYQREVAALIRHKAKA